MSWKTPKKRKRKLIIIKKLSAPDRNHGEVPFTVSNCRFLCLLQSPHFWAWSFCL